MLELDKYMNSPLSLEEKETYLFDLIQKLDRESFSIFSETLDLSNKSVYKIGDLSKRLRTLIDITTVTIDAFEYLYKIESRSYDFATKRYQLRALLTSITTVFTFLISAFGGILTFVILNHQNNKAFVNELDAINSRYSRFNHAELHRINTTLENCTRILYGKTHKMKEMFRLEDQTIAYANSYLSLYLNGLFTIEFMNSIPEAIKNEIIEMLQKDLNTDNSNFTELLERAKEQKAMSLKLINEFETKKEI